MFECISRTSDGAALARSSAARYLSRMRYVPFGVLSLALSALGLYGIFHGAAPFVMLMLGLAGLGIMASFVVSVVARGSTRRAALFAMAACATPWLILPVGGLISRRLVRNAQSYCEALAPVARSQHEQTGRWPTVNEIAIVGLPRPWLLEQGRSVRYPFSFHADDYGFVCQFPDPTMPRLSFTGEGTPNGRWVWEHLMD
jgi:hypothetical protein